MFKDSPYFAYCWVNKHYMKEIQYGIQSAHCISDMSRLPFGQEIYGEWADKHKSILIFDGTNSGTVRRIYEIIQYVARNFRKAGIEIPHTIFREDQESLDGATTACGFIMPDVLRRIDWMTSLNYNNELHCELARFIPSVKDGDELYTPFVNDTPTYYEKVMDANAWHAAHTSAAGYTGSKREDYAADRFRLAEFSDWMGRQRLA